MVAICLYGTFGIHLLLVYAAVVPSWYGAICNINQHIKFFTE